MSNTVSIRLQPVTGRKAAGQIAHDMRAPGHTPDYIDQLRTHENDVLLSPPSPTTLRAEIAKTRTEAGQQSLRADSRTMISGIITFGREAQDVIATLSRQEQNAVYARIATRIEKETQHKLLGLVVHRDESAPHAHFMLRGYRLENGKELPWRFTPADMSKIQDMAAEEVSALGIQRGTRKATRIARGEDASKTVNRSVQQLHADLPAEIHKLEQKRDDYARLIEKAKTQLEKDGAKEDALKKRIETYEKRIQGIERELGKMPELPTKKQLIGDGYVVKKLDLADYKETVENWAKKYTLQEQQAIERERVELREAMERIAKREADVIAREKERAKDADTIRQLKNERAIVGRKIGDAFGIENSGMLANATFAAAVKAHTLREAVSDVAKTQTRDRGRGLSL